MTDINKTNNIAEPNYTTPGKFSRPSRFWKRLIGGFILIALVIAALIVRRIIFMPVTKPVGRLNEFSGEIVLYMHQTIEPDGAKSGKILWEGHRIETKQGAKAQIDGCLEQPTYTIPVVLFLGENSCIGLMRPPAIDIEKGSFDAIVPPDSMGLRVNLKEPQYSMSAQCLAQNCRMSVQRKGDELIVTVLEGQARLWNIQGEVTITAGHKGSINPQDKPVSSKISNQLMTQPKWFK